MIAAVRRPRTERRLSLLADWKLATTILSRQLAVQSEILGEQIAGADPFIDRMMRINDNAWLMRTNAGAERGYMQTAVIDNRVPSLELQRSLAETKGKIDARWSDIEAEAQRSSMPASLKAVIANAQRSISPIIAPCATGCWRSWRQAKAYHHRSGLCRSLQSGSVQHAGAFSHRAEPDRRARAAPGRGRSAIFLPRHRADAGYPSDWPGFTGYLCPQARDPSAQGASPAP